MGFVARDWRPSTLRMWVFAGARNGPNNNPGGAGEGEQAFPSLFQAVGDSAVLEPPFADEGLAANLYLLGCRRVDHVVVVRGDLVMQPLGGMGEQVPVLVDRTAL